MEHISLKLAVLIYRWWSIFPTTSSVLPVSAAAVSSMDYFSMYYNTNCVSLKWICISSNVKLFIFKKLIVYSPENHNICCQILRLKYISFEEKRSTAIKGHSIFKIKKECVSCWWSPVVVILVACDPTYTAVHCLQSCILVAGSHL